MKRVAKASSTALLQKAIRGSAHCQKSMTLQALARRTIFPESSFPGDREALEGTAE